MSHLQFPQVFHDNLSHAWLLLVESRETVQDILTLLLTACDGGGGTSVGSAHLAHTLLLFSTPGFSSLELASCPSHASQYGPILRATNRIPLS